MSREVDLTVIVPVFDRAECLRRAIGTICRQSEKISVIVVNDGSAAEYADAFEKLATEGSQVRVVHQSNQGPAAARNAGLSLTSSRYVMFLDSDDELVETALAAMTPLLQNDDVGLLCGSVRVVSPDGASRLAHPAVLPGGPWTKLSCLSGSFAVRTDVARAIGGYDAALRLGENTDFILRLAEECRRRSLRITVTNDVLSIYYAASDERRYDAKRLDAAVHLLRRGRFDLQIASERARLHAIAAVNAARVGRYELSVRHGALAVLAEPRNPRHLVRLALSLGGPLARRHWLKSRLRSI